MVVPDTEIRLLKMPLQISNKHQLTFSNISSQYSYFEGLQHLLLDDTSYQRKDNVIRYNGEFDTIMNYNYCMYKNKNYSNKWIFAFITNMEYVNDGLTLITIKTDVWQTWQFDLNFRKSFVEREMINTNEDVPRGKFNSRKS